MDFLTAVAIGQANRDKPEMVFDWDKAAKIIRDRHAHHAAAGLRGDWEWTGGTIYSDGKPDTESYTFLASTWATPELEVDGETIACFRMESDVPDWDSGTKWPESALAILAARIDAEPMDWTEYRREHDSHDMER